MVNKECPFCGGDNFTTAEAGQIHEVESVQCINTGCILEGEWFRVDDWNNQPIVDKLLQQVVRLNEIAARNFSDCFDAQEEVDRLTALLKPFADGYERAGFKCSWASNYTHADAYKNAYNGLKLQP